MSLLWKCLFSIYPNSGSLSSQWDLSINFLTKANFFFGLGKDNLSFMLFKLFL